MWFFRNADYDFLGQRQKAYVVSALLLALGIGSLAMRGGLQYGVDFTGGTLMQVEFEEQVAVGELRGVMTGAGFDGAQLQGFGTVNEFLIRVQVQEGLTGQQVQDEIEAALAGAYGEEGYNVLRVESVGPQVGEELQQKAAIAILLSFLLTLVYLAFRFEWRFGIASIIATFHDILLTFGFISVMNVEITLATVAAILTIVGYSLNDTIVVFDRIRENLKGGSGADYDAVVNRSINQNLPRTLMTSMTTLVTLVALATVGGEVIRPFAVVLVLGVAIGTYSSVFVASPALLEIHRYQEKRARAEAAHVS